MITESLLVLAAAGTGGIAYARSKRSRLYRALEERIGATVAATRVDLGTALQQPAPSFEHRLAHLTNVFPESTIARLREEAMRLVGPERSYIPTHKKGGTVAYETLCEAAPAIVSLYRSRDMQTLISRIVGVEVRPTPINDQSSLSVLFYDKPGDHIGWHYDHNFYRGRHFTVLLPIINQGRDPQGLSHARLKAMVTGQETDVATAPNSLVVFEGARINHKVTPINEGELRMVISMTYCTDPRATVVQGAARRIKDIAFFGPRALWT